LTVSTALTGAGILTNTNNCTLDIKGTISADIVATAPGNIVLYSKNGDQTVRTEDYVNLYLVGSGIKTISAGLDIAGDLYVANGVTADLTGDSTVNRLAIVSQTPVVPGVWGAVGSVNLVDHESASITGAGSITVPDITPPTVAITMSDYDLTVGETATITFTFSEAPVDFGDTDVTVENGTISSVVATGDPLVFTATFTPTAGISDTTNIVTVGKDWTDVASNPPAVTTVSANYTINTIRARTTSTGSYAAGHTPSYIATPTVTPTTTSTSTLFVFTKLLKYSMINNDVKELQKFLNTHGYQVATTGAGSPGHETNYFGTLTKKAVIKFQLANKLVGDGIIGPKTNTVINSLK